MTIKQEHQDMVNKTHQVMVRQLAKSGVKMISEFTANDHHLWHMAAALMSEVAEVTEAVQRVITTNDMDVENLTEELGDCAFYLEGIRQALNIDYDIPERAIPAFPLVDHHPRATQAKSLRQRNEWLADLNREIVIFGGRILDWCKRVVIYRKEMEEDVMATYMGTFESGLELLGAFYGVTHEDALNHNLRKLLKGDRPRYKTGVYSDAQANARSDKT